MTKPRGTTWETMNVEQKSELVGKYALEGLSASAIAEKIPGCASRNAIISHAHRYGIKLARGQRRRVTADAPKKNAKSQKPAKKVSLPAMSSNQIVAFASDKKAPAAFAASAAPAGDRRRPFDPLPGIEPIRIEDMPRLGRCRWPVNGDGREAIFCGCATVPNTSAYCETHAQFSRSKEAVNGKDS